MCCCLRKFDCMQQNALHMQPGTERLHVDSDGVAPTAAILQVGALVHTEGHSAWRSSNGFTSSRVEADEGTRVLQYQKKKKLGVWSLVRVLGVSHSGMTADQLRDLV